MFEIKCTVTGETKKVRKPVFMSRVNRVQRLARKMSGEQITVADAINELGRSYVGIVGRKTEQCDFLGIPNLFVQAMQMKPKRARKAKTVKQAVSNLAKAVATVVAKPAAPATTFAPVAAVVATASK